MKPFVYVNAGNEREAIAALTTDRNRFVPIAGGTDLLSLMKDFIVSPERLVNVKNLDSAITAVDGGLRIGAAARTDRAASSQGPRSVSRCASPR